MTLYVSDLDGTLLNAMDKISDETIDIILPLIKKNLNFTIATGRSLFYSKHVIETLGIKLPVILNNGVYVYDPFNQEFLVKNFLETEVVMKVLHIFDEYNLHPFVYVVNTNYEEKIYHKELLKEGMQKVFKWKISNGDNRQILVEEYDEIKECEFIQISIMDDEKTVRNLYERIKDFDLNAYVTNDFNFKGYYWLEIINPKASKGQAMLYLKNLLKADRVVCFGDNMNDISMFESADESYAVANAVEDLKQIATEVIGSHNLNSVAKYIHMREEQNARE